MSSKFSRSTNSQHEKRENFGDYSQAKQSLIKTGTKENMRFLSRLKKQTQAKFEFRKLCKEAREEVESDIKSTLEDAESVNLNRFGRSFIDYTGTLETDDDLETVEVSGNFIPLPWGVSWGRGPVKGKSYGRGLSKDHCRVLHSGKSQQRVSGVFDGGFFEIDDGLLSLVTGKIYWIESSRYVWPKTTHLVKGTLTIDPNIKGALCERIVLQDVSIVRDDGVRGRYTNAENGRAVYAKWQGKGGSGGGGGGGYSSGGSGKKKKTTGKSSTPISFSSPSYPKYDYGCTGVGIPVHDCGY